VPFEFDRLFYDTCGSYYPDVYVRTARAGIWRDLRVLNLDVMPVHVNPVLGKIQIADTVRVTVSYGGSSGFSPHVADWIVPLYGRWTAPNSVDTQLRGYSQLLLVLSRAQIAQS
jgi:hypothetical protein